MTGMSKFVNAAAPAPLVDPAAGNIILASLKDAFGQPGARQELIAAYEECHPQGIDGLSAYFGRTGGAASVPAAANTSSAGMNIKGGR